MAFDPSKIRARLASEKKWYEITNLAGGEVDVMLYGEIGWLGTTAEDFVRDLKQLQASQINLHLSSPGGGVFDGIAIMNALRAHPANVTVYVDALAASIASVIAMAGDRIVVRQAAEFMVHEASGLCIGNASDLRELADLLDRQSDKIAGVYAARAGGTVEDWRAAMAKETWYSAQEAVDAGLADEIDEPVKEDQGASDKMALAAAWDLSVFRYAGRDQAPAPEPIAKAGAPEDAPTPVADARVEAPPKPTPPQGGVVEGAPVVDAGHPPQFVVSLAELLGDEVVAKLRAAVKPEPVAAAGPEPALEPAPAPAAVVRELVDTASPVHHTATEDRPWDAGPNEKRLPSPMTLATAKKMYAWYDESQVEDGELTKAACKLPHHEVSADGTPGAANLSGVRNALARLPQSDIPASQHDAVRRHLQAHLDDAKQADNRAPASPQNVAQQFQQGDRVRITVPPHEEGQDVGTVEEINGNAYGITFDGLEDMGVHRWYVDDELEPAEDTPDRTPPEPPAAPDDAVPEDAWAAAVARLTEPRPDPWAEAFAHLVNPQPSSSAATAAA